MVCDNRYESFYVKADFLRVLKDRFPGFTKQLFKERDDKGVWSIMTLYYDREDKHIATRTGGRGWIFNPIVIGYIGIKEESDKDEKNRS